MKGRFSIRYDQYTDELFFCNLSESYTLGYLSDSLREYSRTGILLAHDVVEHSIAQRRKSYVTYEDEIRALGAVEFVRGDEGFDVYNEVYYQVSNIHRDIKPVPYIIGKFLLNGYYISTGMMRYLIQKGVSPSNARNSCYQYAWGNYQKSQQFNGCNYSARNAFEFINRNANAVLCAISELYSGGASIYFDSTKQIFRYQMKWEH